MPLSRQCHRILGGCAAFAVAAAAPAAAQEGAGADSARDIRADRLLALSRLHGVVDYFHPALAGAAVPFDSAVAAAALHIVAAPTPEEYARRISAVLAPLRDPVTRAVAGKTPPRLPPIAWRAPQRRRAYQGFPTELGSTSGGYTAYWAPASGDTIHRHTVDMGDGVWVTVRLSGPVPPDSAGLLAEGSQSWEIPLMPRQFPAEPFPSAGYRVLAGIRLWNTARYFFPYRDLMDGDWDGPARRALRELEDARDAAEYVRAIASLGTHLQDSHVNLEHPQLTLDLGASVPVHLQMVEGLPVVVGFPGTPPAGLQIGDEIVSVDGVPAAELMARRAIHTAASTPQSLMQRMAGGLLRGPPGSAAHVSVRGAGGAIRPVTLRRVVRSGQVRQRSTPLLAILPGNVGYADLDGMTREMTDSMFRMFKDTKAIIFDMRGYPRGTAWTIAPRLAVRDSAVVAKFRCPHVTSPDPERNGFIEFEQSVIRRGERYTGPTIMLIDERAMSQAEHTGLFLGAANGTRLIGSPTQGANGDVTLLTLPGSLLLSFTGQAVMFPDGRQLQRAGLKPDVYVRPTIAGLRAGQDEVLARALRYVAELP